MNKSVKKVWLKALRSGKYKQGKSALRVGKDKFCCLGVLCDIHAKKFNVDWDDKTYLNEGEFLPEKVMKWAKLKEDDVSIETKDKSLSQANDGGKSFKQIANIIEKEL